MSNPNLYPKYPSQPDDDYNDYSTSLFGKPINALKKDKTARTFTALLVKGLWVNSIVSAIATVLLAIPLFALATFGTLSFGVLGFLFFLLLLLAVVSLIAIGVFWSASNTMVMWLLMMTTKNKILSSIVAPLLVGVVIFIVRFSELGFDNPFSYIAYGFIGANAITSLILNLRSQIPIPENIFKGMSFKPKKPDTVSGVAATNEAKTADKDALGNTQTDLPPSFTEHKSED